MFLFDSSSRSRWPFDLTVENNWAEGNVLLLESTKLIFGSVPGIHHSRLSHLVLRVLNFFEWITKDWMRWDTENLRSGPHVFRQNFVTKLFTVSGRQVPTVTVHNKIVFMIHDLQLVPLAGWGIVVSLPVLLITSAVTKSH
jgi:hypothetical protein